MVERSCSQAFHAAAFVRNCSTVPTIALRRAVLPSGLVSRQRKVQTSWPCLRCSLRSDPCWYFSRVNIHFLPISRGLTIGRITLAQSSDLGHWLESANSGLCGWREVHH